MKIEQLITDISAICEDAVSTGDTRRIADLRYVLEHLGTYLAHRECAVEARNNDANESALDIETRAAALLAQLQLDASAMVVASPGYWTRGNA